VSMASARLQEGMLCHIMEKVRAGERLSFEDGVNLFKSSDLLTIGAMADFVRRKKNGDRVYFIINRHINHTNICCNRCKLCAFGKDKEDEGAYVLSLDEIEEKVKESKDSHFSEIHIVGGLNPELRLEYYTEMLRRVRRVLPDVHIQAFTAVEIDYLARLHGLTIKSVLEKLRDAGLGSLPGGGAEIFAPRVRDIICARKISGDRWLEVHEVAHRLGMRTNATMLFGHVETIEERVEHLIKLRELQDRTGGFAAFIPLAFHPQNTGLENMGITGTTGYDDLKVLAISRLMLDNFDHIKAFWIMLGTKIAQVSLAFGVDDLDGTVVEEKITHAAGAQTAQSLTRDELIDLIRAAGMVPVERDTLYNVIREGFN